MTQNEEMPWSLILKIISPSGRGLSSAARDENHPLYWRREALAYQSGMLTDLPGGVVTPAVIAINEQSDDTIWLWLEDVVDTSNLIWSLEQYGLAAWHLGRFNGTYLTHSARPDYPWLGQVPSPRGLLNAFEDIQNLIADPATWEHPLMRAAFPFPITERLLSLWRDRAVLLDRLESLPQTLCHMDAWRANMFSRLGEQRPAQHQLLLIDWAYVGYATLGTDVADLFGASYHKSVVEPCEPHVLYAIIFENYIRGLRDEGWQGDERTVRFAINVIAALKYGITMFWVPDISNESRHVIWVGPTGQPFEAFVDQQARLIYYLLDLADDARRMMTEIKPGRRNPAQIHSS
jgi:hypothetical protein